jgi:GH24 family phage-related lysozyme (muramidase)
VAEIEALDIPQELKQKLEPYAGLKGQEAVYFLNSHPLHLTEGEANALDRAVSQDIIGTVAARYNAAAPGRSFTELPPEAQTVIADLAYQYGPNLAQSAPTFWADVTAGRWKSAVGDLSTFGDRYPARRSAEASLLERAIDRGAFGAY